MCLTVVLCLQVDLCAEEMGNNVRPAAALLGDINAIVTQVPSLQLGLHTNTHICLYVVSVGVHSHKSNLKSLFDSLFVCFLLQLLQCVRNDVWKYPSDAEWWSTLKDKIAANAKISKVG